MSDVFAPLRQPPPTPGGPEPVEVRRRGDRLRRRRTVLAVAFSSVVVATVTGGVLLVGSERPGTGPGPVEPPTSETVIPEGLDLADGLPRSPARSAEGPLVLPGCGGPLTYADDAVASTGVTLDDGPDVNARGVSVFPDVSTARAAVRGLVEAFEGCPRRSGPQGLEWTTSVRASDHGDEGWVVVSSLGQGASPGTSEVVQLVRSGPHLLVTRQLEGHGVTPEALLRGTDDQVDWLEQRQLCLLEDEGCAWRRDPDVLRPDGWGPLRLGMSRAEVEATTSATFTEVEGCTLVELPEGTGVISESDELVSLGGGAGVTTPAGIGPGSTREDVMGAYWLAGEGRPVTRVRASPTTDYELDYDGDRVRRLTLSTAGFRCPE